MTAEAPALSDTHSSSGVEGPASDARFLALTLALFTVLTAVMTYPQVLRMSDGVHDPADPLMVTWVLSWVAHQLPIAPAHIFDANIFYPERNTLAYSETLLVPGLFAAPLHWLGVGPILIYNLVFLSGFALSGVGVALLVRRLTGNNGAALLAGIVFAFPPYRIDHYAHLQLQQTQFIPLALWAFHRLLDSGRVRDGVLLGAFTAGQLLSCMYYGLFLLPYMAVVCGTMLIANRRMPRERLVALVVAAGIVTTAMVPVGRAYLAARDVVGQRGREEVAQNSATWRNYLAPPEVNAVYGKVFARFMEPERRLFPGFVAIALAIIALAPKRKRDHSANPEHPANLEHPSTPRTMSTPEPRRPSRLRSRPDARLRCVARLQRRDLPRAVRLLPAVQGAAHSGADGADGRFLARRAGGVRRGADRGAPAISERAPGGADGYRRADARRVRVEAAPALGGAGAAAGELRRSRARRR